MPCITKTAYYQHVETILDVLELEAENDTKQAGQRFQQHIHATVSFDGKWAKRGFTSLTGVAFVISVDIGEVPDYHVLFKVLPELCGKRGTVNLKRNLKNGK